MIYVLDACAMIALVNGEEGSEVVDEVLTDRANTCYAHALNLCEVYYDVIRRSRSSEDVVLSVVDDILAAGVVERQDMGRSFWRVVGRHKARGRISLADCVCLALAAEVGGTLLTSDHGEFDPVASLSICPIRFIR